MRRTHILDLRQRTSDDGSAIGVPYSLGAGWSRSDFGVYEVNLSSGWGGVHVHDLRTAHGIVGSTDAKGPWKITSKERPIRNPRFKVVKGNGLEMRFIVSLKQSSNETISTFNSIKVQSEANASLCGVQVAPMSVDNNSIFHHLLVTTIWLLYDYYMSLSFEFDSCIEVEERLCGWNLQAFTFAYLHRIDANRDVCVWISESYRHSGRWIYTTREKQQHRQRRRFGEGSIFKYKKEAGTWQPKRCSIHNTFEGLGRFGESATAVLFKRFLKVRYLTCLVDVICFLVVSRLRHLDISIYIYTLTI